MIFTHLNFHMKVFHFDVMILIVKSRETIVTIITLGDLLQVIVYNGVSIVHGSTYQVLV